MVAGKSTPEYQTHQSPLTTPQFSHAATKIAVAQICRSAGFRGCQPSALEALTRISTFYLQCLAHSAAASAAVGGRTQSNLLDVVCALEELASSRGFDGASRPPRCLLSSGTLRELRSFVRTTVELPFAKPLPVRLGDHLPAENFGLGDDSRKRKEIPPWLPDFPDVRHEGIKDEVRTELHWEDQQVEQEERGVRQGLLIEEDRRAKQLPLKRGRVKFRVLGKAKGKRKEKGIVFLNCNGIEENLNVW